MKKINKHLLTKKTTSNRNIEKVSLFNKNNHKYSNGFQENEIEF